METTIGRAPLRARGSIKRVLLVSNLYEPFVRGGAERSVAFLAQGLAQLGVEVHVATLGDADGFEVRSGICVHRIRQPNLYWLYRGAPYDWLKPTWHLLDLRNPLGRIRFARILDEVRPDVVHTNNLSGFSTSVWAEPRNLGIPLVHSLRDYYLLCMRSSLFRNGVNCSSPCVACSVSSTIRRRSGRQVDGVIGVSQHVLDRHLRTGAFADALHTVIPNAYEIPSGEAPSDPADDGPVRLRYMGEISTAKGVDRLLRAMHDVPRTTHRLDLAGRPDAHAGSWFDPSSLDPHVKYLGPSTPSQVFRDAEVLVVPSAWEEPLGRVAIEAACWRVPVLASGNGGLNQLVHEYQLGWTLPDSAEEWSSTIRNLSRPAIRERRSRLDGVAELFHPRVIADLHLDFYSRASHRSGK